MRSVAQVRIPAPSTWDPAPDVCQPSGGLPVGPKFEKPGPAANLVPKPPSLAHLARGGVSVI